MRDGTIPFGKKTKKDELLNSIIKVIRNSLNVAEVKSNIVNQVGNFFVADRCFIKIFDNISGLAEYCEYKSDKNIKTLIDSDFDNFFTQVTSLYYRTDQEFIVRNTDGYVITGQNNNAVIKNIKEVFEAKSCYSFPIIVDNILVGALAVHYINSPVDLTEDEIELLKAIAMQAGFAIKQAKMYEDMQLQAYREKLIRRITEKIRVSLDFDDVIQNVCYELFNLFNVDKVAISKYSEFEGNPIWKFLVEYQVEDIPKLNGIIPSYCTSKIFAQEIFENSENLVIDDISTDTRYPEYFKNMYSRIGVKSILAVPIIKNHEKWGAIGLINCKQSRKWTSEEINLVKILADDISIAINQAEMYSYIKKQSEKKAIILSNDNILINQKLAQNIGLSQAISYSVVANKYYCLKNEGAIERNELFAINIHNLMNYTCLSEIEQRSSLESLYELGLITLTMDTYNNDDILISIIDDKNLIYHFLHDKNSITQEEYKYSTNDLENSYCSFDELLSRYEKSFSTHCLKAVEYFFTKVYNTNILEEINISKLYFLIICRSFADLIIKDNLTLDNTISIIDELFSKNSKIISINNNTVILAKKLKKVLLYRFYEAQSLLSIDIDTKIDFNKFLAEKDWSEIKGLFESFSKFN